ncbi:MAG: hypothetical protein H0X65_00005 [Gemmatimonadetes bacterium]|nr:hypothetical protein [Gemmatimonadota bacterium]
MWPLLFLTFVLLTNLTESGILRQNNVFWILYVATVSSLGMMTLGADRAPDPARLPPERANREGAGMLSPGVRHRSRRLATAHPGSSPDIHTSRTGPGR